jgi:23S rRNA pseudouridine1911/1915/1917 synthase
MPDEARRVRFTADRGDARQRLDRVLVRRLGSVARLSRTRVRRWIASAAVLVDGSPVTRPASRVRDGASVEVVLPDDAARRTRPLPEPGPLDILYEDDDLIAVNKPAGAVVHPSYRNTSGTLINAILWHVRRRPDLRPGIVTRLDKLTSGVLIVALSPGVHAALQRAGVRKEYLAVVAGTPRATRGVIDLPLARDPRDRRRIVVADDGARSVTRYEVLGTSRGIATLRCELITGRTHQIRVHLAHRGWPLLGDAAYGVPHPGLTRQALHAWRAAFTHPATGQRIALTAPVPPDLIDFVAAASAAGPRAEPGGRARGR